MDFNYQPISHEISLGNLQLHYVDWGGSGSPVVLVHGLGSTLHIWDLVVPHLAGNRRVVALDLRGHGLSGQPDVGYDFGTIAQDVVNFIHTLGLATPVSLVGHSWGANIVLYLAAHFPAVVRDFALVDGGVMAFKSQWPQWKIAKQKLTPAPVAGKTAEEMRAWIRTEWLREAWTPALGELAMNSYAVDEKGRVEPRLRSVPHLQIAKALWEFDPTKFYARVRAPALLVMPIPPGQAQVLDAWHMDKRQQVEVAARALQRCRVIWMPETIHDIPWQRPKALADLLTEFWQGVASSRPS